MRCTISSVFLLFHIIAECSSSPLLFNTISTNRRKREEDASSEGEYNLPPTKESHNPYGAGTNPIPFQPTINGGPAFPFVNQFSEGLDIDPGDIFYMKGHLNVPVPGWGDMKGKLMGGPSHIWENYGHLLSPTNILKKPAPAGFAGFQRDAEMSLDNVAGESGNAGSGNVVPVATLPTGWQPVKCRPPFCNPYVHSFDAGVQVEPGDDRWVEGSLDLPIKSTAGDHFPLDGSLYAGTMPIQALYGHVFSPVNPPKGMGNRGLLNFKRFNAENNKFLRGARNGNSDGVEENATEFTDLPPLPPKNQAGNGNKFLQPFSTNGDNSPSDSSATRIPFRQFFPNNEDFATKSAFVLPPPMQ